MQYFELHCRSNFSFLEGASHPAELVEQAAAVGYHGLALTDRETVAGVVRGHTAAKDLGARYLVGTEVHPIDAPSMVLWPTDRAAYARAAVRRAGDPNTLASHVGKMLNEASPEQKQAFWDELLRSAAGR